jgi:pimeloyl-ACP methyl ester carboxylesterase
MHVLEAGFEEQGRPCVVLLHGFPELAYTWRNQLLPLASAGFHAIAPDLRGYGRSVTAPVRFDDDLLPYALLNRVADVLGLVRALGYKKVAAMIGHDWGAPTAAWCALVRPDVFQWLFADTVKGAKASAALYSIVSTARANGLEPYAYLRRLFAELPKSKTVEDFEALLPFNTAPI